MSHIDYDYSNSELFSQSASKCQNKRTSERGLEQLSSHLKKLNCNNIEDPSKFCDCVAIISKNGLRLEKEEFNKSKNLFEQYSTKVKEDFTFDGITIMESFNIINEFIENEEEFKACFSGPGKFFDGYDKIDSNNVEGLTASQKIKVDVYNSLKELYPSFSKEEEYSDAENSLSSYFSLTKNNEKLDSLSQYDLHLHNFPIYKTLLSEEKFINLRDSDAPVARKIIIAKRMAEQKIDDLCNTVSSNIQEPDTELSSYSLQKDLLGLDNENDQTVENQYRGSMSKIISSNSGDLSLEELFNLDKFFCATREPVLVSEGTVALIEETKKIHESNYDAIEKKNKIEKDIRNLNNDIEIREQKAQELKVAIEVSALIKDSSIGTSINDERVQLIVNSNFPELSELQDIIWNNYSEKTGSIMIDPTNKKIDMVVSGLSKNMTINRNSLRKNKLKKKEFQNSNILLGRELADLGVKLQKNKNSLASLVGWDKAERLFREAGYDIEQKKYGSKLAEIKRNYSRDKKQAKLREEKYGKVIKKNKNSISSGGLVKGLSTPRESLSKTKKTVRQAKAQIKQENEYKKIPRKTENSFSFDNIATKGREIKSIRPLSTDKTARELELESQLQALQSYLKRNKETQESNDSKELSDLKKQVEIEKVKVEKDGLERQLKELQQAKLNNTKTSNLNNRGNVSVKDAKPSHQVSNDAPVQYSSVNSDSGRSSVAKSSGSGQSSAPSAEISSQSISPRSFSSSQESSHSATQGKASTDSSAISGTSSFSLTSKIDPQVESNSRVVKLDFSLDSIPESNRDIFLKSLFLEGENSLVLELPNGEKLIVENKVKKNPSKKFTKADVSKEIKLNNRKKRLTHDDLKNILNLSISEDQ